MHLDFVDRKLAVVEKRRCQRCIAASRCKHIGKIVNAAGAAGSKDRNVHEIADGFRHLQIVAGFGAIGVHRGQEDLAGTALFQLLYPFEQIFSRVDAGRR